MRVLVVTDGSTSVEAIRQQLGSEGVPVTTVSLNEASRPTITGSFLSGTLPGGIRDGHFQGVVLPSDVPPGLSYAELSALASYESAFSVRQVDASVFPSGHLGLRAPAYAGGLDGTGVTVTAAAKVDGFGYLNGSFSFEGTPGGELSYGYIARPASPSFTPYLTAAIPGAGEAGTLAGMYRDGRQEQLEISFGYNYDQLQYRYIAPAVTAWVTRGVYIGYWRSYLTVDYDDVFNANAEWSPASHCTPGADFCPLNVRATTPTRMTPADVRFAVAWQRQHHFRMEFLFNGGSTLRFRVHGTDPLLRAFQPVASQFWWISHTYTHNWLGCTQDLSVVPWHCVTDGGQTQYVGEAEVQSQIEDNVAWAKTNGIPMSQAEFAPGEYSGLRLLPQQPADNPNMISAIDSDGIRWVAMDASREPGMRQIGSAWGVPRHPIDVFYNTDTKTDETSEYNWIYDSTADGGSGACSAAGGSACLKPLDLKTGWDRSILPVQIQTMLGGVVQNDPRPFFMHQSNLTGDRLGYPVMDGVLTEYRAVYSSSAPVVNERLSAAGTALLAQGTWARARAAGKVRGYIQGNRVTITGPARTMVPVTVPEGARTSTRNGAAFGSPYAGERSGYQTLGSGALTVWLGGPPYTATGDS
jgi:hypothetical protein